MKRFAMILFAAAMLVGGSGVASAQMHSGGGMHGGGGWSGGSGGWHGGGGSGGWHGGGWHGGGYWHGGWYGVGYGFPYWGWGWGAWPGYYYPYYAASYGAYPYYSGYPVSYDYSAPTYIQQDAPAYTERRYSGQGENYLYYCPDLGYYPQVPACAKGWLRVVPSGAPGPGAPAQQ